MLPRADTHAGGERLVHDDVLLVVDDVRTHVVRGNRPRRLTGRPPDGQERKDRPPGDVVGRLCVYPECLLRDLVQMVVARSSDRFEVEAHVIPVIWPPFTVST